MKNKSSVPKRILCSLLIMASTISTVSAAEGATFTGDKVDLITVGEDTDLFGGLTKGIMPGDSINKSIQIKNDSSKKVTFYFGVQQFAFDDDTHQKQSDELLKNIELKIYNGEKKIYDDTAQGQNFNETQSYIELGSLSGGQKMDLDIKMQISSQLKNQYQENLGKVKFVFYCDVSRSGGGGGGGDTNGSNKPDGSGSGSNTGSGSGSQGSNGSQDIGGSGSGSHIEEPIEDIIVPGNSEDNTKFVPDKIIIVDERTLGNLPKTGSENSATIWIVCPILIIAYVFISKTKRKI